MTTLRDFGRRASTLLLRGAAMTGAATGRKAAADQAMMDFRRLVARADAARDARDFHVAAALYEAALEIGPADVGIRIQCGHMLKEIGELARAERHYLEAWRQTPADADLALQLGHFYKVAGRSAESERAYARALELSPGWAEPARELETLSRTSAPPSPVAEPVAVDEAFDLDRLVPELFPRTSGALRRTFLDGIQMRRLGARREPSRWGLVGTLRGIEAVRGVCISRTPLHQLTIALDGEPLHRERIEGRPLVEGREDQAKYVFNVWLDLSDVAPGLHQVELGLHAADPHDGTPLFAHREYVVVAAPLAEADHPDCDGVVESRARSPVAIRADINSRPSVVRPAVRSVLPEPPKAVLILRTDQLGDLVTSIPAIRRLRELLPDARLVGLLTVANVELATSLALFDEIIIADFPDDPVERRRIMSPPVQEALRAKLEPYAFDIAIDLAESAVSRPLLRLSGARLLFGFDDRSWPWLDGGFDGTTHDRRNGLEIAAQSTKVLALVERLGSTLGSRAEVCRRPELSRDRLDAYGLSGTDRFVVMHTGARIAFSRWPHYPDLASLVLEKSEFKAVIMTDDPDLRRRLPKTLDSDRFLLLDRRVPFDDLDALLSFGAVFIGNDSGPKHLAALRGTPAVSIHSSRINWNEWGQELTGSIISRKVPCAGCAIFHDDDECGADFACIRRISPAEVFEEISRFF